jgi:hypothetical protein
MKLRSTYNPTVEWTVETSEDLIRSVMDNEDISDAMVGVLGRLLDALPLTDQQKLTIVNPYSVWEVVQ